MKRRKHIGKWLLIVAILLAVVLIPRGVTLMIENQKQEQIQALRTFFNSDEIRSRMEKVLKHEDPHALTDQGIIKTYELDYERMGEHAGRNIRMVLNDDPEIYIGIKFLKVNGKWEIGTMQYSNGLHKLLHGGGSDTYGVIRQRHNCNHCASWNRHHDVE